MEWLLLSAYFAAIFWYAARTDKHAARVLGLAVNGDPLADWRILRARAYVNRRVGLLNHLGLPEKGGLLLAPGRAVHTRGMLFPIDLVFLDRAGKVLEIRTGVAPGETRCAGPRGTRQVLELASGAAGTHTNIATGATLTFPTAVAPA